MNSADNDATLVDRLAHMTVPLIVVHGRDGAVDGNLMKLGPPKRMSCVSV